MKYRYDKSVICLIPVILLIYKVTVSFEWKPIAITACYGNSSGLANGNDTSVIDAIEGWTVHLWCHYCNKQEDYNPKLWFYKPRGMLHFEEATKEIEISDEIDNNVSITLSHTLNFNYFKPNYSGIYTCKSYDNGNKEKFTFIVEGVMHVEVSPKIGTLSQWQEYKRTYLDPINKKFKLSYEEPYKTFRRNFDIVLKVCTVWDNWSACKDIDGHQKGKRKKLGRCRICRANNTAKENVKNKGTFKITSSYMITSYLTDGYDVPCRSLKLNESLPEISRVVRNIPDYEAEEMCSIPKKIESNSFLSNTKHKTTQQVMEDSHVTLMCNEVIPNSDLKWFKDKKMLKSLYGNIFNKREDEPHISIDASNSLHIVHISKNEEGNYTCSINGKKVKQFEVKVVSKSKLLNQEFIRYSIYLGFVLSLTMTCYCTGVCVAWHRRASFADPLNLYKKKTFSNSKQEQEKLLD